jgi:hypothetical protein
VPAPWNKEKKPFCLHAGRTEHRQNLGGKIQTLQRVLCISFQKLPETRFENAGKRTKTRAEVERG